MPRLLPILLVFRGTAPDSCPRRPIDPARTVPPALYRHTWPQRGVATSLPLSSELPVRDASGVTRQTTSRLLPIWPRQAHPARRSHRPFGQSVARGASTDVAAHSRRPLNELCVRAAA